MMVKTAIQPLQSTNTTESQLTSQSTWMRLYFTRTDTELVIWSEKKKEQEEEEEKWWNKGCCSLHLDFFLFHLWLLSVENQHNKAILSWDQIEHVKVRTHLYINVLNVPLVVVLRTCSFCAFVWSASHLQRKSYETMEPPWLHLFSTLCKAPG